MRAIPKGLPGFVPRGGKTRFWGESKLRYRRQKVWIHVYDVRKARFAKDQVNMNGKQDSGLDLFVFSKSHRLKRLSSTRFTYGRYGSYKRGSDHETVGVETLWLDSQHKIPIVQVTLQNPNGKFGMISKFTLAVFTQGLAKKATGQLLLGERSGDRDEYSSWSTGFDRDKRGLLVIDFIFNTYTPGVTKKNPRTIYTWDGSNFKKQESPVPKNPATSSPPKRS